MAGKSATSENRSNLLSGRCRSGFPAADQQGPQSLPVPRPLIGGPAPIGYCLDERAGIADGLFLGQLIYASALQPAFNSGIDSAGYDYELFGYFLLLDDDRERHRQDSGLDTINNNRRLIMQIDFHHATTYVVARDAGFSHPDADVIAYAAQYVDDATCSGPVYFDNGAAYNRISSAHKMLDIRNTVELANHCVWMPFHFLPGNGGLPADQNPQGSFIDKIVCTPDSPIAQEMVRDAIIEKNRAYGLHRLGVTLHVYADTWAHQGFAGVVHPVNEVEHAVETDNCGVFSGGIATFLRNILDDTIPPLGHGRAQVFPDMPFLKWQYKNGRGKLVTRNNPADFLEACEKMCIAMRRYRLGDANATVAGMGEATREQIGMMFAGALSGDEKARHQRWLEAIRNGVFTVCGKVDMDDYHPLGEASWKADALGTSDELPEYRYKTDFLTSHWKHFHDAVQAHRFNVVYNILPKYGICAA